MGIISLRAVTRKYVSDTFSRKVLSNADLELEEGVFSVVCGPSGSGKSTLLNLMGAIDRPDEGSVNLCGAEVADMSQRALARFRNLNIGFVFQSFHLLPVLTAAENVAWPLYFRGVSRTKRMKAAREHLSMVGLADHAGKIPGRLSGGQRQRVAIARALVGAPAIVLADEPTASLDRNTALKIMDLIAGLAIEKKATIICATHDPLVIERASQIIYLRDGKPCMDGQSEKRSGRGNAGYALSFRP
ncbi:MAG: ABC transporter ATP-binding protein [Roseovarius sp.]|nr:ABC transporter ATP-binding protein [Roseovarius sp.]